MACLCDVDYEKTALSLYSLHWYPLEVVLTSASVRIHQLQVEETSSFQLKRGLTWDRVSAVLGSLGRKESEHPVGCCREKWPRTCLPPLKPFCEPAVSSEAQHRFGSVSTVREEASPWFLALVMVTNCPIPRPCEELIDDMPRSW